MRVSRLGTFIVVLIAALAAWRLWRPPSNAGNLEIVPDAVEYAVAADRFATHQGYNLLIDGVTYPSRYPPWFSVGIVAPVLYFARGELGAAILPVFALGIVSILAAFAIGKRLAGTWGAAGAALALLLNPAFAALARRVMTDIPALAFGLVGCWLYLGRADRRDDPTDGTTTRLRDALFAGLLGGAGFALRSECLAILVPFGWRILRSERRPAASFGLLALPSLLVAAATAWYNAATFGDWRRSGYHYWCPNLFDVPGMALGLRFVPRNLETFLPAPRIAVLVFGAAGAIALFVRHRENARRAMSYLVFAALPGTLLHLVYFYPGVRFHIFLLALASILGGAGLGSLAAMAARGKLWPIPVLLALAAFVPPRDPLAPPYRRSVADALARETPSDAVIVTGLDSVFLEPYVLRGSSRTIVPASRSVEYASKLVAPSRLRGVDLQPSESRSPRAPEIRRAGAIDVFTAVATESPGMLASWVRAGRPVFIDESFLPEDAPLERILDPSLIVVHNPRFSWLGELRVRSRDADHP